MQNLNMNITLYNVSRSVVLQCLQLVQECIRYILRGRFGMSFIKQKVGDGRLMYKRGIGDDMHQITPTEPSDYRRKLQVNSSFDFNISYIVLNLLGISICFTSEL